MAEGLDPNANSVHGFLPTTRLNRTMIHSTPKTDETKSHCKLCTITEKLPMIQCDSCDQWFHFRCVGLSTFDESQLWVCTSCKRYNENYDNKVVDTCGICHITGKLRMVRCKSCHVAFHIACINLQDVYDITQDWTCDVCNGKKLPSTKAKSVTSSTRAKAKLKLEMLASIKDLKDKAANDEMKLVKKFIKDQQERDLDFIVTKFDAIQDLESDTDDLEETNSFQEDKSAIDVIKSKRLSNWLTQQDTAHLRSQIHEFDNLSQTTIKSSDKFRFARTSEEGSQSPSKILVNSTVDPLTFGILHHLGRSQPPTQPGQLKQPDPITRLQISARQALSKDLPFFFGDAEDWPMFISAYNNSTKTCGYRNDENLLRLQKCLKGDAKTAVRNYLTFPDGVPRVIETLRMLFGNEEKIFNSLLMKIRKQPSPNPDDLMSLVKFSLSVQNLCGIIEASDMQNGMNNSLLIQELVDKLPTTIKLSWGIYKINLKEVTIRLLSDWLYEIAKGACSVSTASTTRSRSNREEREDSKPQPSDHIWKDKRTNLNLHQALSNQTRTNGSNSNKGSFSVANTEKKCCLCPTKTHTLNDCPDFNGMIPEHRWLTVKNNKLCRFCLGPHFYLTCKQKTTCGVNGCEYKHHPKLHKTIIVESTPKKDEKTVQVTSESTTNSALKPKPYNVHFERSHLATLRYILVQLYYGLKTLQVVAFLDEGATSTMVNRNVADFLGVQGGEKEDLLLKWTKGISRVEEDSERVSLEISGIAPGSKRYRMENVNTVDDLDLERQSLDVKVLANDYPYLRNVPAYSYQNATAQIIIGLDNWKLGIPLRVIDKGWSDPVATKTRLGWEIHGEQVPTKSVKINHHTKMFEYDKQDDELHKMVLEFFSLENFGVKVLDSSLESKENSRSRSILESTMRNIGNRYEVGLLWKCDTVKLPDSFPMAVSRFINFQRQLKSKPELAATVMEQMRGYVEKGYVEKLSKKEADIRTERTWYLPIFPKTYPKKPDKVRLVWDAAAKVGETSLNSMLLQGPDNYTNLVDILRRFREGRVPLLADIKEWYHQIKVCERDQDSQRFLWPSDNPLERFDIYKLKVLSFGAACSPSTATEVKNRHALKYEEQSPRAVKAITKNHYVDDWLDRFDNEEEAIEVGREVKRIHLEAGFHIRNWISCSPNVIKALDGDPEQSVKALNCDFENRTERVLGMWWCVESDKFTFSLKYSPVHQEVLTGRKVPTKREMLSTLMSVYDPLGFLASFLVHAKILLQDTWRSPIGWDDQIGADLNQRWKSWVAVLPRIEEVRISRHYSPKISADNQTSLQLHVFVDASELAYSSVAYLRVEDKNGVDVALVGGKTKTAPLKPISIPRLELQSFVLGVRHSNSIMEGLELPISRRYIWTDSSTVLRWLRSDHRKYNQFVGARIGEILEGSKSSEWRWVPRDLNVADDATRWRTEPDLSMSSRWFQGPKFLQEADSEWPKPTFDIRSEPMEEMRKCFVGTHSHQILRRIDIDVKRFSNLKKLIRVLVLVRRFISKLMKNIRTNIVQSGPQTQEELRQAEIDLFQQAQYDGFREEILSLKSGSDYVHRTSKIYRNSPYLDENGVLRMKGRIDAAKCISFDTKRPIILPIDHHITKLIVLDYHEKFVHQNHHTVLNEIKQRFLIPRLRVFLKNIVPKICQFCKNKRAVPKPPQMADLPEARLQAFTRPFSYVGVDYAGPFYVTIFRRVVKRWIVLMTCLVVRAIHIEIASSLDTDSCIMCIRNFMNIRGTSIEIFSDNGTNFVGCHNELSKELEKIDHLKLHEEFTSCYTKWHFNPPTASHMGGVWERLVRSVKTTLYAVMPKRNPNDELFRCWLMEVVNIVNSRPLTFVPLDPDCEEALTPNHFLLGSSNGMKPPGIFNNEGLILRRNWRIAQQLADNFWQKWIMEYLPIITRRSKWFEKVKPFEVGDIVILVEEENIRNSWPKGRVIEIFEDSKTDQVRSVRVQTERGIYKRPVHKLAILDVRESEEMVDSPLENSTEGRMLAAAPIENVKPAMNHE